MSPVPISRRWTCGRATRGVGEYLPRLENEGCQEPALRSGREAPSSSGRRRRRATRRTRRSVSIAPPKAGRGTECARMELSVAAARRRVTDRDPDGRSRELRVKDRRYCPSDSGRKARKSPTRRETQKPRQPIHRRAKTSANGNGLTSSRNCRPTQS
jgi:hypothetical protein